MDNANTKAERVVFRCSSSLKRAIRIAAAERGLSVEGVLHELLSVSLGLPNASDAEQADSGPKIRTAI